MATILKRNQKENRFELVIDGTLTGYTTGQNEQEHKDGAKTLIQMAEQKGHEVHLIGVKLDDKE